MSLLSEGIHQFVTDQLKTQNFTVIPLAGDASSRRYFRIVHQDQSWVLMSWDPFENPEQFPFLNVLRHFQKHDVHVPDVVGMAPKLGQMLLEDLGDLTLERKFWENQNQEMVLPFYRMAIDEIIKIHFAASKDVQPSCTAFQIAFDTKKFLWEMNYGREHVLEKLNLLQLSPKVNDDLTRIFTDICEKLDREPKHISHRDYHSRNLMLKLGKMRVIDFQDARMGPVYYDLVSLLYDSYVNLSPSSREQILDYYLTEARPHLGVVDKSRFDHYMKLQILQRCFKACGSFASFYNLRSDRRYLKYIQPTLKTVAATLTSFPEYASFLSVLIDQGLLEKNFEELCKP